MFAIAFFFAFILYFVVCFFIVWLVWKNAKKYGYSGKKWSVLVGLILVGIVFWDWLPMEVMHSYKCSKYAGFYLNKTIDKWVEENPGVWGELDADSFPDGYLVKVKYGREKSERRYYLLPDKTEMIVRYNNAGKYVGTDLKRPDGSSGYLLNQRFYWDSKRTKLYLHIFKKEKRIIDLKTEDVIASYIDYDTDIPSIGMGSDSLSGYKVWMRKGGCEVNSAAKNNFNNLIRKI